MGIETEAKCSSSVKIIFSNESVTASIEPQLSYRPGDQQFIRRAQFDFGSLTVSSSAEIEIEFTAVLVPSADQGKGAFHSASLSFLRVLLSLNRP